MFFQLSLPASLPSPETHHTLESLAIGAPVTLTVEVLTREERVALAQRAHGRVIGRDTQAGAVRVSAPRVAGAPVTFTP
jgi:hypothetical protein